MELPPALRRALVAGCLTLASTASLAATAAAAAPGGGAARGTATWAEAPGDPPDYIFPFLSLRYLKASTVNQFQYLMYRPLYWFGHGRGVGLNQALSLATPPSFDPQRSTVTIHMKGWRWSNGETVDARSVLFFLNMLHADRSSFGDYVPGSFPDNVIGVETPDPSTVEIKLAAPVNPAWFTANNLSSITPFPLAWDRSSDAGAPGSGGCASAAYGRADRACDAVYNFLSGKAGYNPDDPSAPNTMLATYASEPLWQVVDGPWRLEHFDAQGHVTMVANPSYSGRRPSFSRFVELPFSSEADELKALRAGSIDVGYLPRNAVTRPTSQPGRSGGNASGLAAYRLSPQYLWSINYVPFNLASTAKGGQTGAILRQEYLRKALNELVDQPSMVQRIFAGYALPTLGPVPVLPGVATPKGVPRSAAYPYRPSHAARMLATHGWRRSEGWLRCADPSRCGAGIASGTTLELELDYASGNPAVAKVVAAEAASWRRAGIKVETRASSYNAVLSTAVPCSAGVPCAWTMEDWGTGWTFAPDYYPSGDAFLLTGAGSNVGSFSSTAVDQAITASTSSPDPSGLARYAERVKREAPLLWQPMPAYSLVEAKSSLWTRSPLANPLGQLNPEAWYRHR